MKYTDLEFNNLLKKIKRKDQRSVSFISKLLDALGCPSKRFQEKYSSDYNIKKGWIWLLSRLARNVKNVNKVVSSNNDWDKKLNAIYQSVRIRSGCKQGKSLGIRKKPVIVDWGESLKRMMQLNQHTLFRNRDPWHVWCHHVAKNHGRHFDARAERHKQLCDRKKPKDASGEEPIQMLLFRN